MQRALLPVALAALLALVASMAPHAAQALPQGAPGCDPPGCIRGHTFAGFLPPLAPVGEGRDLAWQSMDVLHTATEGDPATVPEVPCINVVFGSTRSPAVRFALEGQGLRAFSDDRWLPCPTAEPLEGGGALLRYYCVIHPWMAAALVVQP